jgi:hypothetical protein
MSLRALGTIFLLTLALAIISSAQTIDSISPASGGIGTQITITGTSLYSSRDMNQLFIGGVETIPISWTNTQIVAVIPSGIPGNSTAIYIYTQYSNRYDDWASNTVLWTVQQPPITSITPTEGYPGDTVVLRGSGFGATQGTSFVTLDSKSAPVSFWNDTEIHVTVPLGARSAGFVLNRAGLSPSTSAAFRVLPFIQSIDPPSGGVGTELQIHGQDLTPLDYQHIIYVNGSPTEASYWSSDLVIVTIRPGSIPPNALTVPIHIQYEWDDGEQIHWMGDTNAFQYPVSQASITSLAPSSGRPTQAIQINGSHFGDLQNQSTVTLSGVPADVVSWSDSRITALIPEGAPTGYISVNVPGIGAGTSWFYVLPWLKSSSPAIAAPGSIATLTGQDLVSYYDVRELLVNGLVVPTVSWTDSQISFVVPSSATGSMTVGARYMVGNDYDGYFETEFSNSLVIPVQLPVSLVLNSVSPTSGYPGEIVTLGGAGFGATQGTSTVTFSNTTAVPVSWNDSQIQVPVPFSATSGPITLTVGSTTVQSASFTVLSPPSVTGLAPTAVR